MKKIGLIIASLVLLIFLVGCSSGEPKGTEDTETSAPAAPESGEDLGGLEGDLEGLDDLEGDLGLDDLEDLGNEFSL
ncbi:hypothetical protein HOM13_02805 [Candidatus Woesearchaeota archaeon]|jgi:hypothetical protein|nr:hypothetical protein [Candidatus Woesearchaeota archaeon]MBT5215641.1 hypothetical protein [Candidatus Woesearchaeota archaeon]MBT6402464.1 hypothetical protein [Candidatus Woesearchaeota archaeon]